MRANEYERSAIKNEAYLKQLDKYNDVSYFKEPKPVRIDTKWEELESDMVDTMTGVAINRLQEHAKKYNETIDVEGLKQGFQKTLSKLRKKKKMGILTFSDLPAINTNFFTLLKCNKQREKSMLKKVLGLGFSPGKATRKGSFNVIEAVWNKYHHKLLSENIELQL